MPETTKTPETQLKAAIKQIDELIETASNTKNVVADHVSRVFGDKVDFSATSSLRITAPAGDANVLKQRLDELETQLNELAVEVSRFGEI